MSALCILICRRDDAASSTLTELASFDLPGPNLSTLQPATTLDDLEATTLTTALCAKTSPIGVLPQARYCWRIQKRGQSVP